jgi:hypothetical protein
MWVLIYVGLFGSAPMMVATTEYWGTYESHEECIVAMRESEFGVQYTDESLICLEVTARDSWGFRLGENEEPELGLENMQGGFGKPVPGDGSLY